MASFSPAYNNYIKPAEGGYANVSGDKGGETYAGIARKFWPSWGGWPTVDAHKPLSTNAMIPALDAAVESFYQAMWNSNSFGSITNQDVANIVYDWFVNSGNTGIKKVQQIIGVTADGSMGPNTVAAINSKNASTLFAQIKSARESFYRSLAANDSTQQKFLQGWLNRLNKFAFSKGGAVALFFLVGTGLVIWKWDSIKKFITT